MSTSRLWTPAHPTALSDDEAMCALCIYEQLLAEEGEEFKAFQEDNGIYAVRGASLALAKHCEMEYERLPQDVRDHILSFDWDYVPRWLKMRVEWDHDQFYLIEGTDEKLKDELWSEYVADRLAPGVET